MKKLLTSGVTLLELVVVLLILSIISTIAVGVYTREVLRAKVAKTRAEIRTLEVAVNRYQIDLGSFPPGGSGSALADEGFNANRPSGPYEGAGYLQLSLRASLNGNSRFPLSARWVGPYIEWDQNRLGDINGNQVTAGLALPQIQFLDPFGTPYYYIPHTEYETWFGTFLPLDDPYFPTETYYNASTFQIISFGPNGQSLETNFVGTEFDDITNWRSPEI